MDQTARANPGPSALAAPGLGVAVAHVMTDPCSSRHPLRIHGTKFLVGVRLSHVLTL